MSETIRTRNAKADIEIGFRLIADARRELTLWAFQQFIRENLSGLGGAGFVTSIGQAIVEAATIDAALATPAPERMR